MPEGARLYGMNKLYDIIAMLLERSTFKGSGKVGLTPPKVEQTLFRINGTKRKDLIEVYAPE
jgi:hypothetical protein